ncbi:hypothetical protein [Streptomyces sp. NPDC013455]|uniref:hypothetical protein n=1 Tax=Streptomyces sp. NPDC013455 TaxID=3155605 RepID=UPI0033CA48BA
MSVHDDINAIQRCIEDLNRALSRLEHQVGGGGLEIRRVRLDAAHLSESVALLREAAAAPATSHRPDLVTISDTPYDISLWTDSDDEGLGARDRRAP